ncbi:hypothetical protein [Kineococcus sp. SYSU DK018]|uniref:hypothetical protein n=1 Tax=Kineococcus sp. SYSU DK018 TaxID=3383139 RepID=UPI003D7CA20E
MGIVTEDGTHELHLASVFADGTRGASYRGVGADAQVQTSYDLDGSSLAEWHRSWRSVDDVVAYALTCDCSTTTATSGRLGGSRSTVLARWERVGKADEEDLDAGRVYAAPGQDAMDLSDRPDVEAAMRRHWDEHLTPGQRTAQLEAAWRRHRQALADVDDAVAAARAAGLSWVDIGRATGMTRQSARERWS